MYRNFFKRILDIFFALFALIIFCWLYAIVAILVKIKMGSPIFFTQIRPGLKDKKTGQEKLFKLYKFRSMTDAKDENGYPLSDNTRLTKFGSWLRTTSLDELPETWNILKGDMSVIGPRPQLVRDMVFMTEEQRHRHNVRPGLSGLAQISGRNSIPWEKKFDYDLKYIQRITFVEDLKIFIKTIGKVLKGSEIVREGTVSDLDLGEYLLSKQSISLAEYEAGQAEARILLASKK